MSTLRKSLFWCTLVSAVASAEDHPIRTDDNLAVAIPWEMKALHIDHPHVKFLIDLGEDGTMFDVMPLASNHRDLIPAGYRKIMATHFEPAVKDGRPVRARTTVRVNFYDPEQQAWKLGSGIRPFGGSANDGVRRRFYLNTKREFVYRESATEDLDEPLRVLQETRRIYSSQHGVRTAGRCLVEYYIGPEGRARFPRAIETDNADVAISAALSLLKSRYAPPRRGGHPTYVKVEQEFVFE